MRWDDDSNARYFTLSHTAARRARRHGDFRAAIGIPIFRKLTSLVSKVAEGWILHT